MPKLNVARQNELVRRLGQQVRRVPLTMKPPSLFKTSILLTPFGPVQYSPGSKNTGLPVTSECGFHNAPPAPSIKSVTELQPLEHTAIPRWKTWIGTCRHYRSIRSNYVIFFNTELK